MPYDSGIREEELKNKLAAEFFAEYDCTRKRLVFPMAHVWQQIRNL